MVNVHNRLKHDDSDPKMLLKNPRDKTTDVIRQNPEMRLFANIPEFCREKLAHNEEWYVRVSR